MKEQTILPKKITKVSTPFEDPSDQDTFTFLKLQLKKGMINHITKTQSSDTNLSFLHTFSVRPSTYSAFKNLVKSFFNS
jgi:hypothetical protein